MLPQHSPNKKTTTTTTQENKTKKHGNVLTTNKSALFLVAILLNVFGNELSLFTQFPKEAQVKLYKINDLFNYFVHSLRFLRLKKKGMFGNWTD